MKNSFRLRLMLLFFVCILIVTLLNRYLSQYFAYQYIHERIQSGMVKVLQQCTPLDESKGDLKHCADVARSQSWMESLPTAYVYCENPSFASSLSTLCQQVHSTQTKWGDIQGNPVPDFEFVLITLGEEQWSAVRQASSLRMLLVEQAVVKRSTDELWGIRNRVMQYVFPVIALMLMVVSWLMASVLLKPVDNIRSKLQKLSSKNLNEPLEVKADYNEFKAFTAVFEELRGRLHNSFLQSQRFSADASHELRTPLTILRGHVELGIAELPSGSSAQIRLSLMGEEIERLIDITEKLLLLSRADSDSLKLDTTEINFSDVLVQMVEDAQLFQSNLSITSNIEPKIRWRCDKNLVYQLIQNLYVNAINYNLPKGWVDFQLKQHNGSLEFSISNPTQEVVKDLTGRAFERFYRGDSAHTRQVDGHGLGLSLCIEIIHLHHGRISLTTEEGNVVKVTLTAPLNPPDVWFG
jgi:signal transduction histidine kinase